MLRRSAPTAFNNPAEFTAGPCKICSKFPIAVVAIALARGSVGWPASTA